MRIASLSLRNFGRFDEAAFDFARGDGGPDLHLVVGNNEAGKTTLRHALIYALFGIESRSPYLYRPGTPSLSAAIEIDGTRHALTRAARGPGGKPPAAIAALKAALQERDVTRGTFALTQAFAHGQMREDAKALLQSNGEISQLLMRDAVGLAHASALKATLQSEADRLHSLDGRKASAYRELEKARKAAASSYDAAKLEAPAYAQLRSDLADAQSRHRDALKAQGRAQERQKALTDLIGAEPVMARIRAIDAALAGLGGARLAADAQTRIDADIAALRKSEALRERAQEDLEAATGEMAEVPVDPDALAVADRVRALADRAAQMDAYAQQRREAQVDAKAARSVILTLAGQIEMPCQDVEAVRAALPSALARTDLEDHADRREGVERRFAEAEANLARLDALTPPEAAQGPSETLLRALQTLDDLGRIDREAKRLEEAVGSAKAQLRAAQEAARGDAACETPLPLDEALAAQAAIEAARDRAEAAEDELARRADVVLSAEQRLRALAAADAPGTAEIAAGRAERDALWRRIAAGVETPQEAAPRYEGLVAAADGLADRRFMNAQAVVEADAAARALTEAQEAHALAGSVLAERRDALQTAARRWQARLDAAGIAPPPADYARWLERRNACLGAADALAAATAQMEAFFGDVASACRAAEVALGEGAVVLPVDPVARVQKVAELLRQAETAARSAVAVANREREAFEAERASRPAREKALAEAAEARALWNDRWKALCAACALDPGRSAQAVRGALRRQGEIEAHFNRLDAAAATIGTVDGRVRQLEEDTAALCAELGESGPAGDLAGTIRALSERVRAAQQSQSRREQLEAAAGRAREEAAAHGGAIADRRAALAADFAAAGLSTEDALEALQEAAQRSDERRRQEAARQEDVGRLAALGHTVESAAAALSEATSAERQAQLEAAGEAVAAAQEARDAAVAEKERATLELRNAEKESRTGDAAASRLSQTILEREMAQAVGEAIERRLEAMVLEAATAAFERENRSPILSRASQIFTTFTAGAYDRLSAEGGGESFVEAHRVEDDLDVGVTNLSEGTRDQLVISIRLAAAQECEMPFIADDLFVNADEERTQNGFRALAELAGKRQVFYLTHDRNGVDLARRALPDAALNVVELTGRDAEGETDFSR